jgi:class 3 adenylate cyclase
VECPSCHADTPDTGKFCVACGAGLPVQCQSCGASNPAGANFCAECGQKLVRRRTAALAPPSDPPSHQTAERRQLTVVFCDLVGSTALSAQLDPEDLRGIIAAYHRCCTELVERNGGFVAKYMGDGVLAYFGYPQAHEHDAERAVHAGLSLVEAVPKLAANAGWPSQVRIGIATGLVVVGDLIGAGAAQEQAVVGETPNLAARLQALAEPGAVVIASSTRKLIGGLFEYRDLGTVALKGFADKVPAWQVLGAACLCGKDEWRVLRRACVPRQSICVSGSALKASAGDPCAFSVIIKMAGIE